MEIPVTEMWLVNSLFAILDCFLRPSRTGMDAPAEEKDEIHLPIAERTAEEIESLFVLSLVWSIGACLEAKYRVKFDQNLREVLSQPKPNGKRIAYPVPQVENLPISATTTPPIRDDCNVNARFQKTIPSFSSSS
jgi:hypothetical protein